MEVQTIILGVLEGDLEDYQGVSDRIYAKYKGKYSPISLIWASEEDNISDILYSNGVLSYKSLELGIYLIYIDSTHGFYHATK